MNCKFVVYNVPWEKRKELLQHECVGLQERLLSCKRSQPVKAAEPVQNDVKEMFDKVQCTKCMEKCFRGPCTLVHYLDQGFLNSTHKVFFLEYLIICFDVLFWNYVFEAGIR